MVKGSHTEGWYSLDGASLGLDLTEHKEEGWLEKSRWGWETKRERASGVAQWERGLLPILTT